MFQINNKNSEVPIKVEIPRIPYFHCDPSKSVIEPNGMGHFVATFRPKQIGNEKGELKL